MSNPNVSKPRAADVARWVAAVQNEPSISRRGPEAVRRRARANNARANLAKHGLGTNGLPLGRIS